MEGGDDVVVVVDDDDAEDKLEEGVKFIIGLRLVLMVSLLEEDSKSWSEFMVGARFENCDLDWIFVTGCCHS